MPAGNRQPLAGEQAADAVLGRHPPPEKSLAMGDQPPPLPGGQVRQRDRRQLTQGGQFGQPQGVVPIGLSLEMLELPGLGGGVGDPDRQAVLAG